MARCSACQITIADDTDVCPLCGNALETDRLQPEESMYPKLILREKVMVRITRLFLEGSIFLEMLLIMINLLVDELHLWCVITGAGLLYVVLVLYTTTIPHMTLRARFLVLSLGLCGIGIAVDWFTGFRGWALSMALPIQIIFMDIVLFILYLISKRDFSHYIWMCVMNIGLCGIVMIAFLLGYRMFFGLMIAAFLLTDVELLAIMVRAGRRTPAELKRRFHA